MLSVLLTSVVLAASPEVRAEVGVEGAFGLGDSVGWGPSLAGRLELVRDEEHFIFSGWVQGQWWPGMELFAGFWHQVSGRVRFGVLTVGVDGELRNVHYAASGEWYGIFAFLAGGGPSVGVMLGDPQLRFEARLQWMPLSNVPDLFRFGAVVEFAWKLLLVRGSVGTAQLGFMRRDPPFFAWPSFTVSAGVRFRW